MRQLYYSPLLLPFLVCGCENTAQDDQRPNILFMAIDDLRTDETKNVADENSEVVENLLPLWEKGNTGLFNFN